MVNEVIQAELWKLSGEKSLRSSGMSADQKKKPNLQIILPEGSWKTCKEGEFKGKK